MCIKIPEFITPYLRKLFTRLKNFFRKEIEQERAIFKQIYSFYLLESKKDASEALNVFCLLETLETDIYVDGRQHSIAVTNIDIEKGYTDSPENIENITILFEQTYPELFSQYEQLKSHRDTLKRIGEGATNEIGIIPDDIRKNIELYYKYFLNTKAKLDSAFKKLAKELQISQQ